MINIKNVYTLFIESDKGNRLEKRCGALSYGKPHILVSLHSLIRKVLKRYGSKEK